MVNQQAGDQEHPWRFHIGLDDEATGSGRETPRGIASVVKGVGPIRDPLEPYLDASGRLTLYPARGPRRLLALDYLASKFELGRRYSEPEVNEILIAWHLFEDHCLLRRELIDFQFLSRTRDGREYWLTPDE